MNIAVKEKSEIGFSFGTKAETLKRITPLLKGVAVEQLYYFTVSDWRKDKENILQEIPLLFAPKQYFAVRSSAVIEDGHERSCAGEFHSCLGVDGHNREDLSAAVEQVIGSYDGNPLNQILIQPMVENIAVSGVIMTRNLEDGAPYYVVNYDDYTGTTNSITAGIGVHKTVLISRHYDERFIESPRLRKMLDLARELEEICGEIPLDIEFGLRHDETLCLFQVRPISLRKNWHAAIETRVTETLPCVEKIFEKMSLPREGILGEKTILATMPDWNPAEMIGVTPRPLAASLYRELITEKIWRLAREKMGYRKVPGEELMVLLFGRPYIDVRNSFNSFLPAGLPDSIGTKLVNAWLQRLNDHPDLHDKVEFEIALTCLDFMFEENLNSRYRGLLTAVEKGRFRQSLLNLTCQCLEPGPQGTLKVSLGLVDQLGKSQQIAKISWRGKTSLEIIRQVYQLLEECKRLGTFSFSMIARHAFIAESFLRSAVAREAIHPERIKDFKMSLQTITSNLAVDLESVCQGEKSKEDFLSRYGHLRPGTYDITSLRYVDREDIFKGNFILEEDSQKKDFTLTEKERISLNKLLQEMGMGRVSPEILLDYAKEAILGREYGKFVFTRNISEALEGLVAWGELYNLSRDDLSFLDIQTIYSFLEHEIASRGDLMNVIARGKALVDLSKEIKLCYILRDKKDVYVVPLFRSAANFIGFGRIETQVVLVNASTSADIDLVGKIACIENADPGFDWIFTKGIKGLITKYGGANSHMAIRCAEFGLPAAIGCGDGTFERIVNTGVVELNCADKILRPFHHR